VSVSLKYAVVERERRYLLARLPGRVTSTREIIDRYVAGTRLRLREVREADGTVTRKLGHKVRLGTGPAEVACTNLYLDDEEWALLTALPAQLLRKRRHLVRRDGWVVAIDEHEDGTLVAEIDDGDEPSNLVPDWLDVVADVSADEAWTGAALARTACQE
jgi:CYTH domain-containing protein